MNFIIKLFILECMLALITVITTTTALPTRIIEDRHLDEHDHLISPPDAQFEFECSDDPLMREFGICSNVKLSGLCKDTSYMAFAQDLCKETCGFCSSSVTISVGQVEESSCRDTSDECEKKYCERNSPFYKANCQKTCNYCTSTEPEPELELYTGPCGVPAVSIPDTDERVAKIVGGEGAEYGAIPWQASLFYQDSFRCGAIVINNQQILTAAHCFDRIDNPSPLDFGVYVGKNNRSPYEIDEGQIRVEINDIFVHPQYNSISFNNDIAVIQLKENIRFNKYVRPVCLPEKNKVFQKDTSAVASGWGKKEDGYPSDILRVVDVKIQNNDECNLSIRQETNKTYDEVTNNMVCAGHAEGKRDSCKGDSGGPLVVKSKNGIHTLAGVVSWGYECGAENLPGVYTRVSNYIDWIHDNMLNANENSPFFNKQTEEEEFEASEHYPVYFDYETEGKLENEDQHSIMFDLLGLENSEAESYYSDYLDYQTENRFETENYFSTPFDSTTENTSEVEDYFQSYFDSQADEKVKEEESKAEDHELLLFDSTTEEEFEANGHYPAYFDSQADENVKEEEFKAENHELFTFVSKLEEEVEANGHYPAHFNSLADEEVKEEDFKAEDHELLLFDSKTEEAFEVDGHYPSQFDSLADEKVKEEESKAEDHELLLFDSKTEEEFEANGHYPAHFDSQADENVKEVEFKSDDHQLLLFDSKTEEA